MKCVVVNLSHPVWGLHGEWHGGAAKAAGVQTRTHVLVAACLCAALTGCASTQIGRAQSLAAAGAKASDTLDAAADHTLRAYESARELQDLQDALLGTPLSAPSKEHQQVVSQLEARHHVATGLKDGYTAFEALSEYNASAEFEQSAARLFEAVDNASHAANSGEKTDRALVEQVGGALLQWRQADRLKKASAALRNALETYKRILDASSPGLISIERDAVNAHYAVVRQLWNRGILQGSSLLAAAAPENGLSVVGKPDAYDRADRTANAVVTFVLESRQQDALRAVIEADTAHRQLVAQLIVKHVEFEKGGALNIAELQSTADQLLAATRVTTKAGGSR